MEDEYKQVILRLKKYRYELKLVQEQMGSKLGVDQPHYSKIEDGTVILSYERLQCMLENSLDIDYIFTGKRSEISELDLLMERCPRQERPDLMRQIVWAIELGYQTIDKETSRHYIKDLEILRLCSYSKHSIWYILRQVNEMTQAQMAECLGMVLKRYRRLEKGVILADGEVMTRLCKNTVYLPSMIVSGKGYTMGRINEIWNKFDDDLAKMLYNHITAGAKMADRIYQRMMKSPIDRGL